jgi:hypothetical protein
LPKATESAIWPQRNPATRRLPEFASVLMAMEQAPALDLKVTLYHKDFLGRGIEVEIPLVYTYKRYERYQFLATVPLHTSASGSRLSFDLGTGYDSRVRDDFFV